MIQEINQPKEQKAQRPIKNEMTTTEIRLIETKKTLNKT
jgi:hypothetical protein